MTSKLISLILVLVLAAMPGLVGAQDECPVAVNATTPIGIMIAKVFQVTESFLDIFVTKEWIAENQTCNITGLTSQGTSLVASLGDITVNVMKIVADIVRTLAGT